MRFLPRLSLPMFVTLSCLMMLGLMFAPSCTERVCRNNDACIIREFGERVGQGDAGYEPVTLLGYLCPATISDAGSPICRASCRNDDDCDKSKGYTCDAQTGKCRCLSTKGDTKTCTTQCFISADCWSRVDSNTKEAIFPQNMGFICQEEFVDGGTVRRCGCPTGAACDPERPMPTEGGETEGGGFEFDDIEGGGFEFDDTEFTDEVPPEGGTNDP